MKFGLIYLPFYFGLSTLIVGILFKIQHWPGGNNLSYLGLLLEAVFLMLILIEIFNSKKAISRTKQIWGISYLLIPVLSICFVPMLVMAIIIFIGGNTYLLKGRKQFIITRREIQQSEFDTI